LTVFDLYSARKHHLPTTLALTALESAVAVLPAPAVSGLSAPADTPPVLHSWLASSWLGLQMKKSTVPVGEPPAAVPVTTAWSVTEVPTGTVPEMGDPDTCGVVTVVVLSGLTLTHSVVLPVSFDGS
jgi:hypothetical protein